jgi:glycosyltransferase involved in cell wall biosynthesis
MILVDYRWTGLNGIARFSREVLPRLDFEHKKLTAGRPLSTLDMLQLPSHLRGSKLFFSPGFNGAISETKQILTVHDLIHLQVPDESSILKRLYFERVVKPAVLKAGAVLTVSETSKMFLDEWLGSANVIVHNVGNGCSPVFSPGTSLMRFNNTILYVGNMKAHKNFEVVIRACKKVKDLTLVVVTNEVMIANRLIQQAGIKNRVSVLSNVPEEDLANLYRKSAALVMPSTIEGFGLPALEAIRCGTPVIFYSGCASVKEIVGNFGLPLDDPSDEDLWASAIEIALGKNDYLTLETKSSNYDWDIVSSKVNQAFLSLTAGC